MTTECDPAAGGEPDPTGTSPATASAATVQPDGSASTVEAPGTLLPQAREQSAEATLLREAMAAVAELPIVDTVRVAALRAAIARGEYHIDADRIAARMLDTDDER